MAKPDDLTAGPAPSAAGNTVTTDVPAGDSVQLVSPLAAPAPEAGVTVVADTPSPGGAGNTISFDAKPAISGDKTIHS
jgi:hypothetical protein